MNLTPSMQKSRQRAARKQAAKRTQIAQERLSGKKQGIVPKARKPKKTAYGRKEIETYTKSQIKKDLDIIFSVWRRMVSANDEGVAYCCSCGEPRHWTMTDNGHYISRAQAPGLIFNEMNTGAQCKRCNGFLEGNATGYREQLIYKHGQAKVELLESQKYLKSGIGLFEMKILLLDYIEKFKVQCARLNHEPNTTQRAVIRRWDKQCKTNIK